MNIKRDQAPSAGPAHPFHFPKFSRYTLKNGLRVLHCEYPKMPLVDFKMIIQPGLYYDPKGKEGLAGLTAELITEGTTSKTATEVTNALEFIAVDLSTHASWDCSMLEFEVTKHHFDDAMDIFYDILLNPTFPEEEFDRLLKEKLINRKRVADHPERLVSEQFNRILYAGHRQGLPSSGTEQSLNSIAVEDVRSFYNRNYIPANATLIITGDISAQEVEKSLQPLSDNWQSAGEVLPLPENHFTHDPTKIYLIDRPDAGQSVMRLGHIGFENNNPDKYAIYVTNLILGGYFSSRINLNLREKNGYTYGAKSSFSARKLTGPFSVSTSVESQYTVPAIREIFNEIRGIQQDEVSRDELEHAVNYISRIYPITFEVSFQINFGLYQIENLNYPDDYFDTWQENLARVTEKDVLAAANKYLHPDNMIITVVGDAAKIESDLSKLYTVVRCSVDGEVL